MIRRGYGADNWSRPAKLGKQQECENAEDRHLNSFHVKLLFRKNLGLSEKDGDYAPQFGSSAILPQQDPWLCVPSLRMVCRFNLRMFYGRSIKGFCPQVLTFPFD
jgi:hypothetical protein